MSRRILHPGQHPLLDAGQDRRAGLVEAEDGCHHFRHVRQVATERDRTRSPQRPLGRPEIVVGDVDASFVATQPIVGLVVPSGEDRVLVDGTVYDAGVVTMGETLDDTRDVPPEGPATGARHAELAPREHIPRRAQQRRSRIEHHDTELVLVLGDFDDLDQHFACAAGREDAANPAQASFE